jgi:VanZ family protein
MAVSTNTKAVWFAWYWAPVIFILSAIFATSCLPGKNVPSLFPNEDILYHGSIYAILALFFLRALRGTLSGRRIVWLMLVTVAFCMFYGATDELHQLFTPGRSCDFMDVGVDTLGALAGSVCGGILARWQRL